MTPSSNEPKVARRVGGERVLGRIVDAAVPCKTEFVFRLAVIASLLALAVPAVALANGKVSFEHMIPSGKSSSVTFSVHQGALFRVVLRVPTRGRAKLFLTGKSVPKGALIDTKTHDCEGAAGSLTCRLNYDPLPPGTYTWRISWTGPKAAYVVLRLRWVTV